MITARVKHVEGLQFLGTADSGHGVVMDGSPKFGGTDSGPSPMELVLMGLGGCTGMDIAYVLKKKKQPLEGLEINLKGELAKSEPKRYSNIEIEFVVKGRGLDEAAVEKAVKLSMEKYCSVKFSLEGQVSISHSFKIAE